MAKSLEFFQKNLQKAGPAAGASSTLLGALLVFGAAGYFLDRWLDRSPWFLLTGLLVGLVIGFYELARAVWKK
ncbi:MAG: AtpZ/AtpI family protein [Acidobacteriota bacterium]